MKKAVILIPETGNDFSVDTNEVNVITIVNALQVLQKHLCQLLVEQAKKAVGNDPRAQERYLDQLCRAAPQGQNRISGNDIFNSN